MYLCWSRSVYAVCMSGLGQRCEGRGQTQRSGSERCTGPDTHVVRAGWEHLGKREQLGKLGRKTGRKQIGKSWPEKLGKPRDPTMRRFLRIVAAQVWAGIPSKRWIVVADIVMRTASGPASLDVKQRQAFLWILPPRCCAPKRRACGLGRDGCGGAGRGPRVWAGQALTSPVFEVYQSAWIFGRAGDNGQRLCEV